MPTTQQQRQTTDQTDSQLERFQRTAKELDCNPSQAEFERKLGKIAQAKPTPKPKSKKTTTTN